MTPRLAEKMSGFRTHGYVARAQPPRDPREIVQREGRHRQAGVPQRGAHRVLVRRAAGALGAVVRQPESLRRERGDHRGRIARRHDSLIGRCAAASAICSAARSGRRRGG